MNESINRKSAGTFTVKDPEMWVPMRVRCVAWFAVLVFAHLPSPAFAQESCPCMHVKILNIRNSTGNVACALFESPDGFPTEYLCCATNVMVIKIREMEARFNFLHIPPGTSGEKLKEIKDATEEAWEDLKAGVESAWDSRSVRL